MNTIVDTDVHFYLLKMIVQNVDEILPLIGDMRSLSDTVKESVKTIFEFINKIIEILPEMTTTNSDKIFILKEMQHSLNRVNYVWKDEFAEVYLIKKEWDSFLYWWIEYFKGFYNLEEMRQGLNLSLN